MDMTTITGAYNGLKTVKDVFTGLVELKIETETLAKINNSLKYVGEAQDALFQLREELFRLQEENRNLKDSLEENKVWETKIANYELIETEGNAVVYRSLKGVDHFACPSCIERKEIHILQDRKVLSGTFDCPGCGKSFSVKNSFQPKPM